MFKRSVSLLAAAVIAASGLVTLSSPAALADGGLPAVLVTPGNGSTMYTSQSRTMEINTSQQSHDESWYLRVLCDIDGEVLQDLYDTGREGAATVHYAELPPTLSTGQTCSVSTWNHLYPEQTFHLGSFTVQDAPTPPAPVTPMRLTPMNRSSSSFYPWVADRYLDTLRVSWHASHTSATTISVRNSRGTLVRSTSSRRIAGTHAWTWNGRNNAGRLVPVGRYAITVAATNSSGGSATRTAPVLVRHGIVTAYKTATKYGWEGIPSTRGSCYATENYDEDTMELDCWGGKFARSTYNFAIPRNATGITWSTGGRLASADICCNGRVKRTGKKVRPTLFQVRVQINGWRAFDVRRATVDYELRVMR